MVIAFKFINIDVTGNFKVPGIDVVGLVDQFDGFGDIVLLVDAPKELRLTRASSRDGLAKEKIQDRMAAQPLMNLISDGGSCTRVNHVLLNDGSVEDLQHRLAEFMEIYGLTKML